LIQNGVASTIILKVAKDGKPQLKECVKKIAFFKVFDALLEILFTFEVKVGFQLFLKFNRETDGRVDMVPVGMVAVLIHCFDGSNWHYQWFLFERQADLSIGLHCWLIRNCSIDL
jgi:hypothetical protein